LCLEGVCSFPIQADFCLIGIECVAAGTLQPDVNCRMCVPGVTWQDWSAAPDSTACDDGDECNVTDECVAGSCVGSGVVDCDDNDDQTIDDCLPDIGCVYEPISQYPKNCQGHLKAGKLDNGVYTIDPDGDGGLAAVETYCDMDGGGWTLMIHRAAKNQQSGCTVSTAGAVGVISGPEAPSDAKLPDEVIKKIENPYYRFDGNYGDGIRQYWKINEPWTSLWSGGGLEYKCTLNEDNWPDAWWNTSVSSYPLGNTTCLGAGYSTIWWHVGQYSCAYIGDPHGWGWRNWDSSPATMNFWVKSK